MSETRVAYRLGCDVGGTFTDFVLYNERSGAIHVEKCLTTPADPSVAILEGLRSFDSIDPEHVARTRRIAHATTLVANANHRAQGRMHRAARDPRLPRRARASPPRPGDDLRALGRSTGAAGPEASADPHRRAHLQRRQRPSPGSSGGDRGGCRPHAGAGGGLGRDRLPALVRQPRERAGGGAPPARARPRDRGDHLRRGAAADQGVRAHQHHGGQRLREAARPALPRQPRRRTRAHRICRAAAGDALQRRPRLYRDRGRLPAATHRVGSGGGGHRRAPDRAGARAAGGAVVRHGRDDGEGVPHPRRGDADHRRARGGALPAIHAIERLSGGGSGGQHDRDRRRRGQHRRDQRHGSGAGRAGERRRRSRADLLRPRRHPADGDRCGPAAGLPRSRQLRRRFDAPRRSRGARRHRRASRPAARTVGARRGVDRA